MRSEQIVGYQQCCLLQVHLFNVEVHNGPVLMEARSTAPGTQVQQLYCSCRAVRLEIHVQCAQDTVSLPA